MPTSSRTVSIHVPDDTEPIRLDRFLAAWAELGVSRNKVQWLIDSGEVLVNGKTPNVSFQIKGGEEIVVTLPPPTPTEVVPQNIPLDIRYEDEYLAVVNKPAGMVTHPAAGVHEGTLANALVYHFKQLRTVTEHNRPGIVHRLDKDTSGLLVIAKDEKTLGLLQRALEAREIHREYLALVCGHMPESEGTIDLPIGRSPNERTKQAVGGTSLRNAITHFKVIDTFRSYDLLQVTLETGRTHQIRVHLGHLNHPVFGDSEYGGREKWHRGQFAPDRIWSKKLLTTLQRQALHARKLSFEHPITHKQVTIESDPPPDFQAVLDVLDRDGR
jgi:23S rRNA pseudouridine1911/1915/1917 synthase